ncbi:MAG: PilN domain-containing protein [Fimbriimonadaceae bacterium]
MSQHPVIEWSPEACLVADPTTHAVSSYVSPTEALAAIGNPKHITLALGRRQVFVKAVRLPDVPINEARNLLRFRLEDLFPVPANEVAYDLVATPDVNAEGREFIVFGTKSDTIKQARALFAHAGTKLDRIIPACIGSEQLGDSALSSLVIAPSSEGIALDAVDHGHVFYSRVAGNLSTQAEVEAEIARVSAASGLTNPTVIAHNSLRELVSPNVRLADLHPLNNLSTHSGEIDLRLPEDLALASSTKLNSRKRLAFYLGLCLAIAAAAAWWSRDEETTKVKKVKEQYSKRVDDLKRQTGLRSTDITKLKNRTTMVADGIEPKQNLSDVVVIAANASPDGLWLTGMNVERGKDLAVRGTAMSNAQVAAFVDALSASARLRDVKLAFSNNNTIGETPVVQFSVTAHVIGNMPLTDPRKDKRARTR